MSDYDVLIIGGGPVGAALALALRGSGLAIGLLEARAPGAATDLRPISLSHGSRLILERLGVWEEGLAGATPIRRIHVSQRGGFGRVALDAQQVGVPALGYVLDYGQLSGVLARALEAGGDARVIRASARALEPESNAAAVVVGTGSAGRVSARLLALADGGALPVARLRVRDYGQAAVTARVSCSLPHRNVAYERFTPDGPLALLPMGEALALVWTAAPERVRELCDLTEAGFLARLQESFGTRLGSYTAASGRASFPLALKVADPIAVPRTVVLGNAAQMLHPVAGQGLNLGLRDAWELAALLRGCDRVHIGAPELIRSYASRRRLDRRGGMLFTDSLVRLFSNERAALRLARGLGLAALGAIPPARDFLARRMIFGARG
jgi:2-octaprenyl-6-methoxyphenol hydroxylase